jgi:uncharacterized membrane protein YdbT with pleckstrin-like domain
MELSANERVIFQAHPTWRAALAFYVRGIVLILIVGALVAGVTAVTSSSIQWDWVVLICLVFLAGVLLIGWIRRMITTYTVTNERLHIRSGLFTRSEQETRLARVQNINTKQTLLERLLKVGDVSFDTAGSENYDFRFRGVGDPQHVVHAVRQAQQDQHQVEQEPSDESSPKLDEGL